jgi:hypothetical protein
MWCYRRVLKWRRHYYSSQRFMSFGQSWEWRNRVPEQRTGAAMVQRLGIVLAVIIRYVIQATAIHLWYLFVICGVTVALSCAGWFKCRLWRRRIGFYPGLSSRGAG